MLLWKNYTKPDLLFILMSSIPKCKHKNFLIFPDGKLINVLLTILSYLKILEHRVIGKWQKNQFANAF